MANHIHERALLRYAIDYPVGVKYLVPAMLRIGLCEHHQFDVCGIATDSAKILV
jgi:hypothetical protein